MCVGWLVGTAKTQQLRDAPNARWRCNNKNSSGSSRNRHQQQQQQNQAAAAASRGALTHVGRLEHLLLQRRLLLRARGRLGRRRGAGRRQPAACACVLRGWWRWCGEWGVEDSEVVSAQRPAPRCSVQRGAAAAAASALASACANPACSLTAKASAPNECSKRTTYNSMHATRAERAGCLGREETSCCRSPQARTHTRPPPPPLHSPSLSAGGGPLPQTLASDEAILSPPGSSILPALC